MLTHRSPLKDIPLHQEPKPGGGEATKMQCPRDGESLASESYRNRVDVDVCPKCKGTFLDPNELASITGMEHDLQRERLFLEDAPHLKCPRCQAAMNGVWFSVERNVMVDTCPSCRGIWLDGAELQNILKEMYGIK